MGGSSSKGKLHRFVKATQNPERLDKFTQKLDISKREILKFFDIFDSIDRDKSGEISLDEFFRKFDLDFNSFGRNIFAAMDTSGDNTVEFIEFMVGLWNYCTLAKDSLAKFSFDMFDIDGSGSIDVEEFKELIAMIHGGKKIDSKAESILKVIDKDRSGEITFTEFLESSKKLPSLMMEAFTLQRKMKEKCLGEKYWKSATKRRKKYLPNGEDLINFHYSLYNDAPLDRSANKQKVQGERVGQIQFKQMTSRSRVVVFESPTRTSLKVGKLLPKEYVVILEEIEVKDKIWYRIEQDEGMKRKGGWVSSIYITIEENK